MEKNMRKKGVQKRFAAGLLIVAVLLFGYGCSAENGETAGAGQTFGNLQTDEEKGKAETSGNAKNSNLSGENSADTGVQEQTDVNQSGENTAEILTVTFMDVGQGNAVLIENEGAYMLIDGGDRDYASYVVSYLKKQGVEELEYVISSHYDADHLNGVVGVLNAFPCEKLLAADYTTDTKVYESLLSVIDENDITVEYPDMGEVYSFGKAEFTIVCPDAYDYDDANDNSIGIRLVHGDNSFLICGDAGEKVEDVMVHSGLKIDADVYLASHHGSAGSSSEEFLRAVAPEVVVISAGLGNSYGHPAKRVMEAVEEIGADIYRTDLQGEIIVTSDGSRLSWNVGPSGDFRSGEELEAAGVTEKNKSGNNAESANSTGSGNDIESGSNNEGEANTGNGESSQEKTFVLNTNTKKFHEPSCSSAADIHEDNRAEFTGTREDLLDAGYSPCGRCNP